MSRFGFIDPNVTLKYPYLEFTPTFHCLHYGTNPRWDELGLGRVREFCQWGESGWDEFGLCLVERIRRSLFLAFVILS